MTTSGTAGLNVNRAQSIVPGLSSASRRVQQRTHLRTQAATLVTNLHRVKGLPPIFNDNSINRLNAIAADFLQHSRTRFPLPGRASGAVHTISFSSFRRQATLTTSISSLSPRSSTPFTAAAPSGPALTPELRALLGPLQPGAASEHILAQLVASRVALPDHTAGVPLLDVLPPAVAEIWRSPEGLIGRTVDIGPAIKPYMGVSPTEYPLLIRRLVLAGMVELRPWAAGRTTNGVFGVIKDATVGSLRLIIDARPANQLRIGGTPMPVCLPTPADLAALQVPTVSPTTGRPPKVWTSKRDISNFFHQLLVPAWMQDILALPALTPEQLRAGGFDPEGPSVPVCLTLPMGFCDSVYLTQQISQHLCRAFIPADRYVINNKDLTSGPLAVIYVDDFVLTCLAEHLPHMRRMDAAVGEAIQRARLPENVPKRVAPTPTTVPVLGTSMRNTAQGPVLSPTPDRIHKLVARTSHVLRQGSCTGKNMERLLGDWAWTILLWRPAFSLLHSAYRFARCAGVAEYTLWPSVRQELTSLLAVLPFIRVALATKPASRVYASDASTEYGGAVVSTLKAQWPAEESRRPQLWRLEWMKAWVGTERSEHINSLEFRAVLASARTVSRRRISLLCDSQVVVGIVNKGRSPSFGLNILARRLMGSLLLSGSRIHATYIPTEVNPADGHSRATRVKRRFSTKPILRFLPP
jgi:hypothetical protein